MLNCPLEGEGEADRGSESKEDEGVAAGAAAALELAAHAARAVGRGVVGWRQPEPGRESEGERHACERL